MRRWKILLLLGSLVPDKKISNMYSLVPWFWCKDTTRIYIHCFKLNATTNDCEVISKRGNGVSWEGTGDVSDHGTEGCGRGCGERDRRRQSGTGMGFQEGELKDRRRTAAALDDGGAVKSLMRLPTRPAWAGVGKRPAGQREASAGDLQLRVERRRTPPRRGAAAGAPSALTRGRRTFDLV